jgi:hypothetical protein
MLALDQDDYARIGRFLSGLRTLQAVRWTSTSFYITLDDQWEECFDGISSYIGLLFPGAIVVNGRLEKRLDWLKAAAPFTAESLIYLHANDDHALTSSPVAFENEANRLACHPDAQLMMVTHFPEVTGMLYRKKFLRPLARGSAFPVGYALGTTLVKTSFYRSWWDSGKFLDDETVYRPDNPVGKSVTFSSIVALAPQHELIRHMDGYAHVLCQAPLAPLRNLIAWENHALILEDKSADIEDYSRGYWPSPLAGLTGAGVDLHETEAFANFSQGVRVAVARVNAQWGLRVNIFDTNRARLWPTKIGAFTFLSGLAIASLLPRNLRNALDNLLDPLTLLCCYTLGRAFPSSLDIAKKIYYLGTLRTVAIALKSSAAT